MLGIIHSYATPLRYHVLRDIAHSYANIHSCFRRPRPSFFRLFLPLLPLPPPTYRARYRRDAAAVFYVMSACLLSAYVDALMMVMAMLIFTRRHISAADVRDLRAMAQRATPMTMSPRRLRQSAARVAICREWRHARHVTVLRLSARCFSMPFECAMPYMMSMRLMRHATPPRSAYDSGRVDAVAAEARMRGVEGGAITHSRAASLSLCCYHDVARAAPRVPSPARCRSVYKKMSLVYDVDVYAARYDTPSHSRRPTPFDTFMMRVASAACGEGKTCCWRYEEGSAPQRYEMLAARSGMKSAQALAAAGVVSAAACWRRAASFQTRQRHHTEAAGMPNGLITSLAHALSAIIPVRHR